MSLLYIKSAERVSQLHTDHSSVFMHGNESSLCERSSYLKQKFNEVNDIKNVQIEYIVTEQGLRSGDYKIFLTNEKLPEEWGKFPAINLSSIDVGELWILIRLLAQKKFSELEFFYLVPDSYGGSEIGKCALRKEISVSGGGWFGLPGLVTPWNIDDMEFRRFSFLGFDMHRLGSIESYEGFPDNLNSTYILADPPTAPYWLERSLRDNHELILDVLQGKRQETSIIRMAGMCPSTTLSQLQDIRNKMPEKQRWCLLPLGPKIQTLGALVFTSNQLEITNKENSEPMVGVLYDFPKPNKDMAGIEKLPQYYWKFKIGII